MQRSSVSFQKLLEINREFERSRNIEYEVIRNNDWLRDYEGWTYSDQLRSALARGLFEEHSKKADVAMSGMEKSLVFCLDPDTLEIQKYGVAGSSLLREKKSEKIWESILQRTMVKKRRVIGDLILDNFAVWFRNSFQLPQTTNDPAAIQTFKDDSNSDQNFFLFNTVAQTLTCGPGNKGSVIKLGSGVTAPVRANYAVQTPLGSAPESGYLPTNNGAYTVSNTVIYQADANPTGGSGTVNEVGSFYQLLNQAATLFKTMITHDVVNNGLPSAVPYTAGKLLRTGITWQL